MTKRKPPEALYLELWPKDSGHDDHVHFELVGYGVDFFADTRITSDIHEYRLVKPSKKARSGKGKRRG